MADVTTPIIVSVVPPPNSTTSPNVDLAVTFNAIVLSAAFTLSGDSDSVAGTTAISGSTAFFNVAGNLTPYTNYDATISATVKDSSGVSQSVSYSWDFSTGSKYDIAEETHNVFVALSMLNGYLARMASAEERIATANEAINADLHALRVLGEDETLGISTTGGMTSMQRAMAINALKNAGMLKDVINEMQHPTKLPKGRRIVDK